MAYSKALAPYGRPTVHTVPVIFYRVVGFVPTTVCVVPQQHSDAPPWPRMTSHRAPARRARRRMAPGPGRASANLARSGVPVEVHRDRRGHLAVEVKDNRPAGAVQQRQHSD